MTKKKELIRWFLEPHSLKEDGSFNEPPRLIKVFSDETCAFFSSKKAADYIKEFDILYMDGAQGNLPELRADFKTIAELQANSKVKKSLQKNIKPEKSKEPIILDPRDIYCRCNPDYIPSKKGGHTMLPCPAFNCIRLGEYKLAKPKLPMETTK